MIIVETCPICGHDLTDLVLTTYPPIPAKHCSHCGYRWEGKREEVVRVPFNPGIKHNGDLTISMHSIIPNPDVSDITTLNDQNLLMKSQCATCPTNVSNGGNGICHCILGSQISY